MPIGGKSDCGIIRVLLAGAQHKFISQEEE